MEVGALGRQEWAAIRKGWYPAEERILAGILPMLKIVGKDIQVLDPCCGTGAFEQALAQGLTIPNTTLTTLGVEIDAERAVLAQQGLTRCIHASYAAVRYALQVSAVWLNPPYGRDGEERLEYDMLADLLEWRVGRPGCVWMILIPQAQIAGELKRLMASAFKDIGVWRIPEPNPFKQALVIGVQKQKAAFNQEMAHYLDTMRSVAPILGTAPKRYEIRGALKPLDQIRFQTEAQRVAEIEAAMMPGLVQGVLNQQGPGMPEMQIALMPDRDMHLALRIQTGIMDGMFATTQGMWLTKAVEEKITEFFTEEGDSAEEWSEIQQDRLYSSVYAVTGNGQFFQIPLMQKQGDR